MNLDLWAQLNLYGHVSWTEYQNMTDDEAKALFLALKKVVERTQASKDDGAMQRFDELVKRHGG